MGSLGSWHVAIAVAVSAALILVAWVAWVAWRRVRLARRLVIDRRGILDPRLGWGWIPWDEVLGVYPPDSTDDAFRVKLRVTDRLAAVLSEERPVVSNGSVEIRLDLAGTGVDPVELMHRIVDGRDPPPVGGRLRDRGQPTSSP